jgi:hypothetical protein
MVALAMEAAREVRMKIGLLVLAVALALAVGVWGQAAPLIEWQHDGVNVTSFTCQIDTGAQVSLGIPSKVDNYYSTALSGCGTITAGVHQLYIYACHVTVCTPSAAITVVKL